MMTKLLPNERLDDLQIRGYEIIQSPGTVLFWNGCSAFVCICKCEKARKALDLGTGTGILPILLEANIRVCIIQDWRFRRRAQIWQSAASAITDWKRGSTL